MAGGGEPAIGFENISKMFGNPINGVCEVRKDDDLSPVAGVLLIEAFFCRMFIDVDQRVDRTQPDRDEPARQPLRRRAVLDAAHQPQCKRRAQRGLRSEVERLREGLERLDTALMRLEREQTTIGLRGRPDRYYHVLVDIYERGRHGLDADTFARLGRERGYDARGLGGFFVGSRAPLRRENGRVIMTTEGHRLLDVYLSRPS